MKRGLRFLCVALITWNLMNSSCGFLEEQGELSAFLNATNPTLKTILSEGANTHKIVDVWVYANGENLGVFPLPNSIPIIPEESEIWISLFAGIRKNGVMSNPVIYPFYEKIELSIQLVGGETLPIQLDFGYAQNVEFVFVEGFEKDHIFQFDEDQDVNTFILMSQTEVLSGNYSGYFQLTEDHPTLEAATLPVFDNLSQDGSPVYLEMDYKNDIELLVGLIGIDDSNNPVKFFKLILNPREDWNKVYVEFTEDLVNSGYGGYRILIAAQLGEQTLESAQIYLDNIKLLQFR